MICLHVVQGASDWKQKFYFPEDKSAWSVKEKNAISTEVNSGDLSKFLNKDRESRVPIKNRKFQFLPLFWETASFTQIG